MTEMKERWARMTGILCATPTCAAPANPAFVLSNPRIGHPEPDAFTGTPRPRR
jgi:hypothetical protein